MPSGLSRRWNPIPGASKGIEDPRCERVKSAAIH
jgi:hypothetical protein